MFKNRVEAGQKLAERLKEYKGKDAVVLAIPRGGVIVGRQIADVLKIPLDIIVTRKIGAPGNPEFALGAVDAKGTIILNKDIQEGFVDHKYISEEARKQQKEARRREEVYRGGRKAHPIEGKTIILTDDGIATGSTMLLAITAARKQRPKEIILAIPVAPPDTAEELSKVVDRAIFLETPMFFSAVAQFYQEFGQTSDQEVIQALKSHAR